MIDIRVDTGNGYDVTVGKGALGLLPEKLKALPGFNRICVVSDENVSALYGEKIRSMLTQTGFQTESFVFTPGESSKNSGTLFSLLEFLAEKKFSRSDVVAALGGGVTGDVAGLAAALYMRGIRYVQIPTTLLAMTDSSVGGKTAVNLSSGKNLAGAFYNPSLVICDTDFLGTLPPQVYAQGMAEVIKYSVICSKELFGDLQKTDAVISDESIAACISFKKKLVEKDCFDFGDRKLLNLGHTAGHAIEKLSGFSVPHGFAVSMGIAMMCRISEKKGFAEENLYGPVTALLKKYNLPVDCPFGIAELFPAMLSDKKHTGEKTDIIIPVKIGKCIIKSFTETELEELLF